MGTIEFKKINVKMFLGILEREQKRKQKVEIDLSFEFDSKVCESTDNIADTVDYSIFYSAIVNLAKEKRYNLIEKFASDIIDVLFRDNRVIHAKVKVSKPNIFPKPTVVSFIIER